MRGGILAIVGSAGSGKSTTSARVLARDYRAGATLVIFDPTGDLSRYLLDFGIGVDEITVVRTLKDANSALAFGRRIIVLHSGSVRDTDALILAWQTLASELRAGFVYACDEAEFVLPNVAHGKNSLLISIVIMARNRHCRIVLCAKKPQRLHIDARGNALWVMCFRADSHSFVDRGCNEFGESSLYEPAYELPVGHYLYRGPFSPSAFEPLPKFDGRRDPLPVPSLLEA